jgi:hypothetical protein
VKLWPTRTKQTAPITDLDAIVAETVSFKYRGKVHQLKPMSLEQFLKFTNAQSELLASVNEDRLLTAKDLAEKYLGVISSVCDTITLDDILAMEQVQVAALYQLVIDLVTGQVDLGDSKKKREKIPIYSFGQVSSSPSVPESLVGQSESH